MNSRRAKMMTFMRDMVCDGSKLDKGEALKREAKGYGKPLRWTSARYLHLAWLWSSDSLVL